MSFRHVGPKALVWCLAVLPIATWGRDQTLVEAAKEQDVPGIRALLQQHADVSARQGDGATALHWAAHWDDRQTAALLIGAGANVNAEDDAGITALSLACLNGSAAIVEILLKAGASPNTTAKSGETPLMTASYSGVPAVVKLLLANKAEVNAKEGLRGQTALMHAVAQNHPEVVKLLLENGADAHARSKAGFTALLFAAQQGNIEIARLLLDAGADVNVTGPDGIGGDTNAVSLVKPNTEASALLVAIDSHQEAMARFLVDRGADVNQHGAGRTPLHSAVQQSMPEIVTALLAHGADPNARLEKPLPLLSRYLAQFTGLDTSPVGATAFWLAADYGDVPMMRLLLKSGADPLVKTKDNTTALMAAAGIDFVEGQDRYGRRWYQPTTLPLQQAALEAVKLCLELGMDLNAVNANGQTALHGAAYMGSNILAQYFVDHGAKLDARNKLGQTPYYITQGIFLGGSFITREETGDLLKKLGADISLGSELNRNGPRTQ